MASRAGLGGMLELGSWPAPRLASAAPSQPAVLSSEAAGPECVRNASVSVRPVRVSERRGLRAQRASASAPGIMPDEAMESYDGYVEEANDTPWDYTWRFWPRHQGRRGQLLPVTWQRPRSGVAQPGVAGPRAAHRGIALSRPGRSGEAALDGTPHSTP